MHQIKTYVIGKKGGEVTLAFPFGKKEKYHMTEPVDYGDVVWVSFDRIRKRIVSASKTPIQEDPGPGPVPPLPPIPIDAPPTYHEVEAETEEEATELIDEEDAVDVLDDEEIGGAYD
jgi:hypothetical protein